MHRRTLLTCFLGCYVHGNRSYRTSKSIYVLELQASWISFLVLMPKHCHSRWPAWLLGTHTLFLLLYSLYFTSLPLCTVFLAWSCMTIRDSGSHDTPFFFTTSMPPCSSSADCIKPHCFDAACRVQWFVWGSCGLARWAQNFCILIFQYFFNCNYRQRITAMARLSAQHMYTHVCSHESSSCVCSAHSCCGQTQACL